MKTLSGKPIVVDNGQKVYNWHKNYKQIQLGFFGNNVGMRREKHINDFLTLNAHGPVYIIKDNQTFTDVGFQVTSEYDSCRTILLTDQKFSRLPCQEIIHQLNKHLLYKNVLVCLNRTYINIDNSYHDQSLESDYQTAIGEWLSKEVNGNVVKTNCN